MQDLQTLDPTSDGPLSPLLGRDHELETLIGACNNALEGQVSVVTLVGDNGVGKSRLVHELLSRLHSEQAARTFVGRATSRETSYEIFANLLRDRFRLNKEQDLAQAQQRMRDEVAKVLKDRKVGDVCHVLGQFVNVPFHESPLTQAVLEDPQTAAALCRSVVKRFLESDASAGGLVLVFEDLHLADDDSLELLGYVIQNVYGPLCVVCTTREELLARRDNWSSLGPTHHQVLRVPPVSDEKAAEIMRALLAPCQDGPPEELVTAGVQMASGNPGLLEQMVQIFHDAGVLRGQGVTGQTWQVDLDRLAIVRLPVTQEEAVGLRVTALNQAERRLLEHAASIGNVFWLGALVALARRDKKPPEFWDPSGQSDIEEISERLQALTLRDYVLRLPESTFRDEVEYVFKHRLEREQLVALTGPALQRRYHQTIADWLAQSENVRSQEEYRALMAHHLELAGCLTRSALTYLDAGDIARRHFAAQKALEYYKKGLELLGDDDARRRIDALHDLGDVLWFLGKTDEALSHFQQMLKLSYRFNLMGKGGAAHNRIGRLYRDTGALDVAEHHLETGLLLFRATGDQRGVSACYDDIGKLKWLRGEYDAALEQMKQALEMRKAIGDHRSIALSLNNIGLVWTDHGQATKAKEALEASLKIRREIKDLLGIIDSLNNLGQLACDQGEHRQALSYFEEAKEVATEVGERNRIAAILTNIGESQLSLGSVDSALAVLLQAKELCDSLGDTLQLAAAERALAKVYLQKNDLRSAKHSIRHAVDLFGQVRSRSHLAVALRTLGEVTGAGAWGEGHQGKAVDYFMRSIAICKEIGNELEVAKSYAAFSEYVQASKLYKNNADILREAQKLGQMANDIFERHRIEKASVHH